MTVAASGVGALWYSRSPGPLGGRKFICATRLHEDVHKLGFPYNPISNGNVFFIAWTSWFAETVVGIYPCAGQTAHPNGAAAAFLSSNWRKFESRSVAPHLNPSTSNALRRSKGESSSFASML